MKELRRCFLLLGNVAGWSRAEIRAMTRFEYLGYLTELPEVVKLIGVRHG